MKIKTKLFYFLVIAAIIATAYLVLKEDTIKNLYIDYSQIQPQSKLYGDRSFTKTMTNSYLST
ncbi:hypothetical protein DSM00_407 [Leeuwenhoekiella aequorea]|uniref:Uncharacterized protein n=1 Tax=Leeuwenhoekiella aequorea TaxID=283736 RepID=A0A4Q0PCV3_9FLAO|nr:hypothetical protein DSM00_407 [Leeuwenhoekiella aequorea]